MMEMYVFMMYEVFKIPQFMKVQSKAVNIAIQYGKYNGLQIHKN